MKDKGIIYGIVISILAISSLIFINTNDSYAFNYQAQNHSLFYSDNIKKLSNDMKLYIANIDDYLIPNSSYIYSDILSENYDFLIKFAIIYINNNKSLFSDKIIHLADSKNEYIDIDTIFEITDDYFGKKDFVVINNDIDILDKYVSLNVNNILFNLEIVKLDIVSNNNFVTANVFYNNGETIKYVFINKNGILKIYNVEVQNDED